MTPASGADFADLVAQFELAGRAALVVEATGESIGLPYRRILDAARAADLVININGMLRHPDLLEPAPVRLYLDLDPAFNQLWAEDGIDVGLDAAHAFRHGRARRRDAGLYPPNRRPFVDRDAAARRPRRLAGGRSCGPGRA